MGLLQELGIVIGTNAKAAQIFETIFPNFLELTFSDPSEYIRSCWASYRNYAEKNKLGNSNNGEIFEIILATLFINEGLMPLYLQSKVAFVPNVSFDLMLFTKERGPICISAKTSLRERYKQADLEAMALKNVHRKSMSFLITLDETEAESLKAKIQAGDTLGLDKVIVATQQEFDLLIMELKGYNFIEAPEVKVIEANKIITAEKIQNLRKRLF